MKKFKNIFYMDKILVVKIFI